MCVCICVAFYLVIGIAHGIHISSCVGLSQSIYLSINLFIHSFFFKLKLKFFTALLSFFGVSSAVCRFSINQRIIVYTHTHTDTRIFDGFLIFEKFGFVCAFCFLHLNTQTKPKLHWMHWIQKNAVAAAAFSQKDWNVFGEGSTNWIEWIFSKLQYNE